MTEKELLKKIYSCIDNTTLEGCDTTERITRLCQDSLRMQDSGKEIPSVAAVCVYPVFVRQAKHLLQGSPIRVASVAGAFPAGQSPIEVKLHEVRYAINEGADEIDMVISRGALIEGKEQQVYDEIAAVRQVSTGHTLKVILETGELQTRTLIRKASQIAITAGADFIKTSTGKTTVSATPDASLVMLEVIREEYEKTHRMVGFKAAGGISTPEAAMQYASMAHSILGDNFFNNQYFRIGASRLVNNIFSLLTL
ncbi:MAG: deoxyribose-phosphate aldolase [Bacteroidales bacterium]|nr:deoxyribose-phosphate aldolase [Bacteroidales bacterium]